MTERHITPEGALRYIRDHDNDVLNWSRERKSVLVEIVRRRAKARGETFLIGGPEHWSKDELVNRLASERYPDLQLALDLHYASHTVDGIPFPGPTVMTGRRR